MLHCGYQTMLSWIWISFHLKWVEVFVPVFHHCITTIWDSFSFSTIKKFLIGILRTEIQPDKTQEITVVSLNFRWIRFYRCSFFVPFRLSLQRFACAVTKSNKRYAVQNREIRVYWRRCYSLMRHVWTSLDVLTSSNRFTHEVVMLAGSWSNHSQQGGYGFKQFGICILFQKKKTQFHWKKIRNPGNLSLFVEKFLVFFFKIL